MQLLVLKNVLVGQLWAVESCRALLAHGIAHGATNFCSCSSWGDQLHHGPCLELGIQPTLAIPKAHLVLRRAHVPIVIRHGQLA